MDLPFRDHYEDSPPVVLPCLIFFAHSMGMVDGRYHIELSFSDGKIVSDSMLITSTRAVVANHFQQLADQLRALDATPPMIAEDD